MLQKVGGISLRPLAPIGKMLTPLFRIGASTSTATAGRAPLAIRWTSSKHLEPLPLESLSDPEEFSAKIRLGGRKLLWAYFTTPNYVFLTQASGSGKAKLDVRRIPPSQTRFDPVGTLIFRGEVGGRQEFALDKQWAVLVDEVGADTLALKIKRRAP